MAELTVNVPPNSAAHDIEAHNRDFMPKPPVFSSKEDERGFLKFRLAQAFRIFGALGYNEGVAGHITVRDPIRPDCFWVNPFGLHFTLIQPSDLLLVDHAGSIQEESGPRRLLNTAAYMIHAAIHAARLDVLCAAHTHSIHGKSFSSLGIPLDMLNQDACAFYDSLTNIKDIVLYSQFNGVVLDEDEGKHIAETLGTKKAAILQNHGLLVATNTIEATLFFYIALERACQAQLMADAAAGAHGTRPVKIPDEEAHKTRKTNGTLVAGWFQGLTEFGLLEAKEGRNFFSSLSKQGASDGSSTKPSN